MRYFRTLAAIIVATNFIPSAANAAVVMYGFQLTPTTIQASDPRDQFNSEFAYGASSSGAFTFDTSTNQLLSFKLPSNSPLVFWTDTTAIVNAALGSAQPCDLQCFIGAVDTGSYYFIDVESISSLTLGSPVGVNLYDDSPNGSGRPTRVSGTLKVTGAIPEPASWAMMLLGFGGMGVAMRRNCRRTMAQMA